MNTELRNRLEEAVEKYVFSLPLPSVERTYCAAKEDFLAGAEHGYKEAVKVAKEWLMNYFVIDNPLMSASGCDLFLRAFENDMNKLWEEKEQC